MAYTLDHFCKDSSTLLGSGQHLAYILPVMSEKLGQLIANPEFVAATFKPEDDFSKKLLHHDSKTDFYVLAHVHQGPKEGPPHSHGASWAIYGTAMGVTGMKEWRRTNSENEDSATLVMSEHYELKKCQTRGYGPHTIHSTIHPAKAWVIRVTGTNLDELPRYRFNRNRDRIVEAA